MNRKGYTLIEILAVIVVLSIVLVIAIPSSVEAYKKSKLKSEDIFVKRLSEVVDEYVTLNVDTLGFTSYQNGSSFVKPTQEDKPVTVGVTTIEVNNLIEEKLLSTGKYVNPNNKKTDCDINAEIEIYKDSDFVYCHKIKASSLECITEDYINNYLDGNGNNYMVDTCVWHEVEA